VTVPAFGLSRTCDSDLQGAGRQRSPAPLHLLKVAAVSVDTFFGRFDRLEGIAEMAKFWHRGRQEREAAEAANVSAWLAELREVPEVAHEDTRPSLYDGAVNDATTSPAGF
jgi:hypothetical protein